MLETQLCFSSLLDQYYAILVVFIYPQTLGVDILNYSVINDMPIERYMK